MTLDEVKSTFPIGAQVRYHSMGLKDKFIYTEIISEPWELGSGDIVIKVAGVSGGVSTEPQHLDLDP